MLIDQRDIKALFKCFDEMVIQPVRKSIGLRNRPLKSVKLRPVRALDKAPNSIRKELLGAEPGEVYKIKLGDGDPEVKSITYPPVKLYVLNNADCAGGHSAFFMDNILWVDHIECIDFNRCDFSGTLLLKQGSRLNLLHHKVDVQLDRGIFMGGSGVENYYHWMIEILPKMKFIDQLGEEFADYPILVFDSVRKIESFRDAFNCFSTRRKVIYLDEGLIYKVGKLAYLTSPSIAPYSLQTNEMFRLEEHFIRRCAVEYVRDKVCEGLSTKGSSGRERLFFSRRTNRRQYNEDEVFKVFEEAGFRKVYMAELSLKEQIEHVQQAEMIAGPTGAEWTNLMFCNPGTKAVCWMNAQAEEFACFSTLAHVSGVDLRYVLYRKKINSMRKMVRETYNVDTKKLADLLSRFS